MQEAKMGNRYFKVVVPSRTEVGAAATKTFTSRENAERYLNEENSGMGGEILEVDEQGQPIQPR
jgi:hypothetical protein